MQSFKMKNHGHCRDFPIQLVENPRIGDLAGFYQRPYAFGAQHLADFPASLEDRDRLQIRFKRPAGGFLGPGTVSPKGRLLPAMLTLCHNYSSFLARSSLPNLTQEAFLGRAEQSYHNSYLNSSFTVTQG